MYLQITTKCNMKCSHCCYSCGKNGKHADYNTVIDMIRYARERDEFVTIGGGEPTLHPRFFDILKHCLEDFDYVWMATNGSQTDSMYRLANIIDGEDYPECDCQEQYTKEELIEYTGDEYGCLCHEKMTDDTIYQEDKLSVALSQDCFHDDIDEKVRSLWLRRANVHQSSHFEIRDVSHHVVAEGRAKRTGSGWEEGCVCSDMVIRPDGKIKLCGCTRSPIIGDIWSGIEEKWDDIIYNNDDFNDERCYKAIKEL